MKQFKLLFLNAGLLFGAVAVTSCSHRSDERVVSHEKEVDVDDNVFTGSRTVEETDNQTVQNRRTGEKVDKKVTKKTKYDRSGNVINTSNEYDTDAAR